MVDSMFEATVFNDSDGALVFALLNSHAGPFIVIQRYIAAAERTGHRARTQLLTIRRQEAQNKAQAARDSAQPNEPNSPPTPTNNKETGTYPCSFVFIRGQSARLIFGRAVSPFQKRHLPLRDGGASTLVGVS
jgi:hypothetical protein